MCIKNPVRGRGGRTTGPAYLVDHAMQVVDDAIGSYANDAKTTGVQMPVAFGIVLALLLVNQSVVIGLTMAKPP